MKSQSLHRIPTPLIGLVLLLASSAASAYQVLSPGSSHEGKTLADWNAAWWTWAWNSPAATDPLGDTTGALANQENDGPVFFLAGSNFAGNIERTFDVPGGVALFFPTVNFWENCVGDVSQSCPGYPADPKPTMLANAAALQGTVTSQVATIDGVPVTDLFSRWEQSDFFSGGTAQAGDALSALYGSFGIDIVGEDIAPSLVYGYYVMVTDLAPGLHTLVYGGSTSAFGGFNYQVTAHINVGAVPLPGALGLLAAGIGGLAPLARRRRHA
ncbi:MAG: VPLPA-CTERM sorting domain-containing protein [Gammaproteobacteria bacterium]